MTDKRLQLAFDLLEGAQFRCSGHQSRCIDVINRLAISFNGTPHHVIGQKNGQIGCSFLNWKPARSLNLAFRSLPSILEITPRLGGVDHDAVKKLVLNTADRC